jgi:hypothetical protein
LDDEERKDLLRNAVTALSHGNLPLADFLAQDVLAAVLDDAGALNIIGIVAAQIGLRDRAIACFERALAAMPSFQAPRDNLERTKAIPAPLEQHGERFLLIKAWGFGFWADVTHVLACLLLAEISGRLPVTHWTRDSLFGDASGRDAFRCFFEPVSAVQIDDLPRFAPSEIYPGKWLPERLKAFDPNRITARGPAGLHLLNRPERLIVSDFYIGVADLVPWIPETHPLHGRSVDAVFRDLIARYLHPVPEIAAAVDAFAAMHFAARPITAVHVRGSDKAKEFVTLDSFNHDYFLLLDALPPEEQIFVLTDDARLLDAFRARYGARVIATESHRSSSDDGPHYSLDVDRVTLGREVAIDTYLALRCDNFIGNGRSNVSAMIALMKVWPPEACRLLAPSQLLQPNLFLHGLRY